MKKHHPNGEPHPKPEIAAYIHRFPDHNWGRTHVYGLVIWGGHHNAHVSRSNSLDAVIVLGVELGAHVVYID